jgi:protein-tyrosine phosphatase
VIASIFRRRTGRADDDRDIAVIAPRDDRPTHDLDVAWRVLVVCTANVSRSPLGQFTLQAALNEAGVPAVVRSAGTMETSSTVDRDMVTVGRELGVEMGLHEPRHITREIMAVDGADLIITNTREHLREVVVLDEASWARTFTLRELDRRLTDQAWALRRDPDEWMDILNDERDLRELLGERPAEDIADPYRRSLDMHREVAGDIDRIMRRVATELLANVPAPR